MTSTQKTPSQTWTRKQGLILAAICLFAGILGGWTIGATRTHSGATHVPIAAATANGDGGSLEQPQNAAPSRELADAQAAPLLAQLKAAPNDPQVLTNLGNLYYDAQQYGAAIDYYGRVLKSRPFDAAVRTDMATSYWYLGNADMAITEFNKALAFAPTNPNTLFNLGVAQWKGKRDATGALTSWEKLLAANPAYEGRSKVAQMMAEARQQGATAK